jgi:hypothetical protein
MYYVILLAFVLLATVLAYQSPPAVDVSVGSLGDRFFLQSSAGLSEREQAFWYTDELAADAQSGRSRWTRQQATITLPAFETAADISLMMRFAGWPTDVVRTDVTQPIVTVRVNDVVTGVFTPTTAFDDYYMVLPADKHQSDELVVQVSVSEVFTSTTQYSDVRPKGIRVERIAAATPNDWIAWTTPSWLVIVRMLAIVTMSYIIAMMWVRRQFRALVMSLVFSIVVVSALVFQRIYTAQLSVVMLYVLAAACALALRRDIIGYVVRLMRRFERGASLGFAWSVAAVVAIAWALNWLPITWWDDQLAARFAVWLLVSALLVLVGGLRPLQGVVEWLNQSWLRHTHRWGVVVVVALVSVAGVVAWQAPFIGHADYADNAVVARNLVAGRGWVVDYISQFYTINDGVTRPQETWPLLQPVWIAAVFMIGGVSDVMARVPNLVAVLLLAVVIMHIGRTVWDARVGAFAALVTIINVFIYRQVVFATTDLMFMLFQTGAIYAVWRMLAPVPDMPFPSRWDHPALKAVIAGGWTGFMLLQKPGSGGMVAIGLGLWLLYEYRHIAPRVVAAQATGMRVWWQSRWQHLWPIVVWGLVAVLIVAPYVERNLRLFGSPAYTTEQYDAWILEYTDWDAIYQVYAADGAIGNGDLPDRSWVLRWGYDSVFHKITVQLSAIQDYLMPSFAQFPHPVREWGGDAAALGMVADSVQWLVLLGILVWRTRATAMIRRVLVFATIPYFVFMVTYWHANEPRYWVSLIPWLGLFAGAATMSIFDRMRSWYGGRVALPALVLLGAVLWSAGAPAVNYALERQQVDRERVAADLDMYRYLRANTPLSAVMMTRVPWQLQWYAERPAVMIPANTDAETLMRLAKHYEVQYLVLDALQRPNEATRALLADMLADPVYGFREIYRTPEYTVQEGKRRYTMQSVVYAFGPDYANVAPLR